jgi:HEAT repeat protein
MFRSILSLAVVAVFCCAVPARTFGQKSQSSTPDESKLIAVLKSDAPQKAKADACRELARVGTKNAVAPLAALLGDEKLSHMARYGLEPIPDPAVDSALRDALAKVKGRNLVGVIGSIGVRRDHQAVGDLTKHLTDSDPEVVQASARALGRIGTLDASKALETTLSKTPEANRLAFYEGLFRCADTLRVQGQRDRAREIYAQLNTEKAPAQVRAGATRAVESIRPR